MEKVNTVGLTLVAQLAAFTRMLSDRHIVMQASFVVRELKAKKLSPHLEGKFVREGRGDKGWLGQARWAI